MAQIVLQGNKVLAYGDNCFIMCGDAVLCTTNGNTYPGATVATCATLPADIGKVGYEYHAGVFVPSGPFGKGSGNVAVVCDECKTLRDSGINLDNMAKIHKHTYQGGGGYGITSKNSVTCPNFKPKIAYIYTLGTLITGVNGQFYYQMPDSFCNAILFNQGDSSGVNVGTSQNGRGVTFGLPIGTIGTIQTVVDGNTMYWWSEVSAADQCNSSNIWYEIILLG